MSKKNPRVLVVGLTFDEANGSGITMTNLFSKFPKDDLAVIALSWNARSSDLSKCPRVYQLGSEETSDIFPLSLFPGKIYSGQLKGKMMKPEGTVVAGTQKQLKASLRLLVYHTLSILGLHHFVHSIKISPKLSRWIEDFKPDVIYCQLAVVNMMRLVKEVSQKYRLPIVIHTMDDWPSTINQPNLFYYYWCWKIDREFRELTDKSSLFLSISEEMCKEYEKRYHKKSVAFHNPINLRKWLPYTKKDWSIRGRCRIIYFGQVNTACNHIALRDISRAVDYLNHHGYKLEFDICSFQSKDKIIKNLDKFRGVRLREPLPHRKIPELLSHYDLCIIPLNINHFTNVFAKLSMPTKASECMISGVPILIYAGKDIALSKEANKNGWAYTVGSRDQEKLRAAIVKMASDEKLRVKVAKTAINYAKNKFDIEKISTDFKRRIAGILK